MPVAAAIFGTDLSATGMGVIVCDTALDEWAAVLAAAQADYDAAVASGVQAAIQATYRVWQNAQSVQRELTRACAHVPLLGSE